MPDNEGKLLSRKEAAKFLGISPNTLAVWASTGRYNLNFIRVGRLVRYRTSDLRLFLEQRLAY
ncbi:helix-turn-helix domain-containing protein [Emticicia fluvialis]|uniref:helix-turn-helix domain-containing protein n=1 Tax=Emticicia fluvialis TaxID=2974474 RepID=UPI002165B60E|nr:helix-turn-helix domain-containing protein [Emticicia fluvialis]